MVGKFSECGVLGVTVNCLNIIPDFEGEEAGADLADPKRFFTIHSKFEFQFSLTLRVNNLRGFCGDTETTRMVKGTLLAAVSVKATVSSRLGDFLAWWSFSKPFEYCLCSADE